MTGLFIDGGVPLFGSVAASGAKNAALPLLAASLMMNGSSTLTNVPHLMDVFTMLKMLNALGVRAEMQPGNRVVINNTKKVKHIAPYDLVTAMRASFFVAGPLVAKTGFAKVPLPGGCSIGSRPIDIHLKGFERLGIQHSIEHGFVELKVKSLRGNSVHLEFPSVGATENVMMAACLAEGTTVIENAAREPEITDLANFLNKAGAKIIGHGSACITIQGVAELNGTDHPVVSDRIEAGSLLIAGAITGGEVTVTNCVPEHSAPMLEKMREAGLVIGIGPDWMSVKAEGRYTGIDFETLPFPGFPTDMQAQMMALLTVANGTSIIKESIFENRFMHAHELMRMGAKIKLDNRHAVISGVPKLAGAEVKITDLRAGAALILAGLVADGRSNIYGLKHLRRGYDDLPGKLRSIGARITD
ncbi:UDP-N-acetylglucosamine 1-carboxyvinyltransferase [bacterium]|nr:UDP-N-acetylglucosamine 1-carboxyvinyltransferase [bacterium]